MIVKWLTSAWKKFKKTLKKDEYFVFWTTLVFYFALYFNPNNKTLVLAFLCLPLFYFLRLKNLRFSLLLATIASLIFLIGKTYIVELIPADQLNSSLYPFGFNAKLVIRPTDILVILMVFVILRDLFLKRIELPLGNKLVVILVVYYLWLLLTSLFFSKDPNLSLIFALHSLGAFCLFVYACIYLPQNKIAINALVAIFSAMIVFEGGLALGQKLKGSQMGLTIEATQEIEVFGEGVDEDPFYYRPIGTFQHANELASFFLPLMFVILGGAFRTRKSKGFLLIVFLIGFISLLLTLGRSAWLSFAPCFLTFLYFAEKRWKILRIRIPSKKGKFFLIVLALVALFGLTVFPRALKTFYSFEETGGGYTRFLLIKETIEAISRYPVFGVGLGNGVRALLDYYLFGGIPHFFSGVHNAFLGVTLETGLIGLFIFLLFLYFSLRLMTVIGFVGRTESRKPLCLGAVLGILSLLINGIFQPYLHWELILTIIVFFTAKIYH